jgi:hypothetical protein
MPLPGNISPACTLCKKFNDFPVPSGDATNQTLSGHARESLVSDIATGDGKMYNLFLQCRETTQYTQTQYPHVDAYQPQDVPYGRAGIAASLDDCKNRIPKDLNTDKGSKSLSRFRMHT